MGKCDASPEESQNLLALEKRLEMAEVLTDRFNRFCLAEVLADSKEKSATAVEHGHIPPVPSEPNPNWINGAGLVDELTERVRMLELALNYVSQQQFPQPDQTYGMLVALALKGKDKTTLKALCPTCGKTYAYQGLCRDYFHQPMPVRDVI